MLVSITSSTLLHAYEPILKSTPFEIVKNEIGQKNTLMLEFGATSCYSCVVMGKLLYKTKKDYPNSKIFFIDVYTDSNIAKKFGIRMIPTQVYLDSKGNVIDKHVGLLSKEELFTSLKKYKIIK